MIRTQIQLTEEQARALKQLAAARGVSMAELIREGVEQIIAASDRRQRRLRALNMLGRYSDQATDVAVDHDRYLDEIYANDDLR